ncbi:MAG: rod-binding protein [Treponema sp.]|jgi:flagellar protein FlgJ|nr:rod-binding protein [Treponema sp.]
MNSIAQFSDLPGLRQVELDQGRMIPFSSVNGRDIRGSSGIEGGAGTDKTGSFADILEKAMSTRHEETASAHTKKPVIDKSSKLYEQCEELETFLLKNVINGMRKTVQKTELFDDGFAGKMYEDMLYDEYARDFARNAGFGFAEMAYLELTGQRGKILADHA